MNNKKVIIFSVVSLFFVLFALISIYKPNNFLPYYVTRPAFLGFMMFMYVSNVQKINKLFFMCQLSAFIAEVVHYKVGGLPLTSVCFYIISFLLLIKIVYSFMRKIKLTYFMAYFLFYISLFAIVFFFVLDENINKVAILFYGLTFALLATLIFVNFLKRMTLANFMLFIAVIVSTISNAIFSMNVSNVLEDPTLLITGTTTALLAHYLICLGFIYKENDVLLKNFEF